MTDQTELIAQRFETEHGLNEPICRRPAPAVSPNRHHTRSRRASTRNAPVTSAAEPKRVTVVRSGALATASTPGISESLAVNEGARNVPIPVGVWQESLHRQSHA